MDKLTLGQAAILFLIQNLVQLGVYWWMSGVRKGEQNEWRKQIESDMREVKRDCRSYGKQLAAITGVANGVKLREEDDDV